MPKIYTNDREVSLFKSDDYFQPGIYLPQRLLAKSIIVLKEWIFKFLENF